MPLFVWVGIGGFLGSVSRYFVGGWVLRFFAKPWLPYGTITVNILGCFIIGVLHALFEVRNITGLEVRSFLFIGILGGFTTFSTFGYEAFGMIRNGHFLATTTYLVSQLVLGIIGVWLGDLLIRSL